MKNISIRGARQNNLKDIDLDIPRNTLTVITGLSGSGKSSLAFDTLYAEGQRRYIESLSTFARQFLEQMEKPDVDSVDGLSPAISIEQKTTTRNVRSTVGTITEIYDYVRLLFSSVGRPHCPVCRKPISRQAVDQIVDRVFQLPRGSRLMILAPVVRQRKGEFKRLFEDYLRKGYLRARVNGRMIQLEDPPELVKRKSHTIEILVDRILVQEGMERRVEESVRHATKMSEGLVLVSVVGGEEFLYSERMACVDCGVDVPTLEPRSFSFNSRFGACAVCGGLGSQMQVSLNRLIQNQAVPIREVQTALQSKELLYLMREAGSALLKHFGIHSRTFIENYPSEMRQALKEGLPQEIAFEYDGYRYQSRFEGISRWFLENIEATRSPQRRRQLQSFLNERDCSACGGSRLRPESRAVTVHGLSIAEYSRMPLPDCRAAFGRIRLTEREDLVAGPILDEIRQRLDFLLELGIDYLTLDRAAITLSAGESQRVRLASQIGSQLRGVLYVLDEPSIGLHARDTANLLNALKKLRDVGNTVIVVEHDAETIRSADHVVDLGPGAGEHGGRVVAQGPLSAVLAVEDSLTGRYLRGQETIPGPLQRRKPGADRVSLKGVRHRNLKDIDVDFPLGVLTVVTGVSGAGKSSLVEEVLYRLLSRRLYDSLQEPGLHRAAEGLDRVDKVIEIDQSPIGRTPRSNPATYAGVFTPIRELFAALPESKMRGYQPGRFSFNVKGGRCEDCQGDGLRKIEMNFLPDVYVQCESCQGSRYNRETLSVKYKGCSISDILNRTIEDAYRILENIPPIEIRLKTLMRVGLGYLRLGQSSTTLSGGEAQRVKLAKELGRRATGKTLYILDEPTTGLHFEDVRRLLAILHELVDLGNTVIVIEHDVDVIRCADWVIDLGPEGGEKGGRLMGEGPPEEISRIEGSHTGDALRRALSSLHAV